MRIALDLGGTNVRAALVDNATIVERISDDCPSAGSECEVTDCIIALIERLFKKGAIEGIGAGVPSIVDRNGGIVYNVANIPSWRNVALGTILEKHFGVPAAVDNDCNCFALGESLYGAGRGKDNVVGITLGTGVGAGLILNGRPYGGVLSGAGEMGSVPFRASDYEHYCSSMYFRDVHHTTAAELAALAAAGDPSALAAWDEFGRNLGEFMCALLYAYAPDTIIVGGGIAASFHLFQKPIHEVIAERYPFEMIAERCSIVKAELPDANLLGAAALLNP